MRMDYRDFTEEEYRKIVKKAKNKAEIITYRDFYNGISSPHQKRIIWRHDIDFSVHRSLRLAEIEAEEGIKSIYFVLFSSTLYNVFEKDIMDKLKKIISLGHEIGVHIDMDMYTEMPSLDVIEKDLHFFANSLTHLFDVTPTSFSFHNPTNEILSTYTDDYISGYINAYSKRIKEQAAYCSDSNGYWRYQRLSDFLDRDDFEVACVLTHPIWWTPEPLSPRERIQRAIDGRGINTGVNYDNMLNRFNRKNIK